MSPDGEKWHYPFKVKETQFVKSDVSSQAQIADILAGTVCDYFSSKTKYAAKSMKYSFKNSKHQYGRSDVRQIPSR